MLKEEKNNKQLLIEKYEKPSFFNEKDCVYIFEDKYGLYHREDDKPAVVTETTSYWIKHGEVHREGDKPAVIRNKNVYNEDGDLKPIYEYRIKFAFHYHLF